MASFKIEVRLSGILRIDPGAYSTVPFVHEYWEEVFLVEGDLVCGSDDKGQGGEQFRGFGRLALVKRDDASHPHPPVVQRRAGSQLS